MKVDNEWIKKRISRAIMKVMEKKGITTYEELYRELVRAGFRQSFSNLYQRLRYGTDRLGWFWEICRLLGEDPVKLLNEEVLSEYRR